MINWIKELFLSKYLGSVVRGLMKSASGFLLALGLAPETVDQFLSSGELVTIAIVNFAVAQLFSYLEKNRK